MRSLLLFVSGVCATLIGQWALTNFAVPLGQPEHPQRRSMAELMQPDVQNNHMDVIVVGAGHAGLAMAARLEREGLRYVVFEKDEPGTSWAQRYDRLHLHTIKKISELPYWPYPSDFPTFVSKDMVAKYLKAYSQFVNVQTHTTVVSTTFSQTHRLWRVVTTGSDGSERVWTCKVLIAATGQEASPLMPQVPGAEQYSGQLLHSADYKNGRPFINQSVLVVGFGNSGSEMAMDLWEHHARPTVLVRSPIHMVPRYLTRIMALFYPVMRRLPPAEHARSQPLVYSLLWPDIHQCNMSLKTTGIVEEIVRYHKAPVQDLGTMQLIRAGEIDVVKSEIEAFVGGKQVRFTDGSVRSYDAVLMATGFNHTQSPFSHFLPTEVSSGLVNSDGVVPSGVEASVQPQLYLLGFEDYMGRLAEMNSETLNVLKDMKIKGYI